MPQRPRRRLRAFLASAPLLALLSVVLAAPAAGVDAGTAAAVAGPGAAQPQGRIATRLTVDTDLRQPSGASAWAIDAYLAAHTPLPKLGAAFKAAERKYHVNAVYLLAHAMHESGFGRSWLAQHRHNLFGWTAYDRDPSGSASGFATDAASIDYVAGQIASSYLAPGGRYYGGAPTLRGMWRYASDPGWGAAIASIANSMILPTLRGRGLSFKVKAPTDPLVTGDTATVTITASPASALPDGLRLAGRIHLATDATAVPTGDADEAFALTSARSRNGAFRVPLAVGPNPGDYVMDLVLADSDGGPLPVADVVPILPIDLRVAPIFDVGFTLEPGGGVVLGVANLGSAAVPALGPEQAGLAVGRQPTILATWLLRGGSAPVSLAHHALPADLAPGGRWDAVVDLGEEELHPGDVLLARLEVPDATGAAEATLPAVLLVEGMSSAPAMPLEPGTDGADAGDAGAGADDDPIRLTTLAPTDPLAAAAVTLVAPPPAVGAAIAAGAPVSP
jgi:hypothetical protein